MRGGGRSMCESAKVRWRIEWPTACRPAATVTAAPLRLPPPSTRAAAAALPAAPLRTASSSAGRAWMMAEWTAAAAHKRRTAEAVRGSSTNAHRRFEQSSRNRGSNASCPPPPPREWGGGAVFAAFAAEGERGVWTARSVGEGGQERRASVRRRAVAAGEEMSRHAVPLRRRRESGPHKVRERDATYVVRSEVAGGARGRGQEMMYRGYRRRQLWTGTKWREGKG